MSPSGIEPELILRTHTQNM